KDEQTAHVDVSPSAVAAHRPRAPHSNAAADESTDDVDAARIENVLLAFGDGELQIHGTTHDLIRRCFVDAPFDVASGIDACDMAGGRDKFRCPGHRVNESDPGI